MDIQGFPINAKKNPLYLRGLNISNLDKKTIEYQQAYKMSISLNSIYHKSILSFFQYI